MRWDDLQLLAVIDERERRGQLGELSNGIAVLQAVAGDTSIEWGRDDRSFAQELLLGRKAGYIEWLGPSLPANVRQPDPVHDANSWLQQIRDVRLTLAGRDRARGRVVLGPLPDPAEDDGRPITGMTLEEIARAIGDTYSVAQLPRYLHDAGVPGEWLTHEGSDSKWEFVFRVLEHLHDGGSMGRRILREFIGGWLEGEHHTPPDPNVRRRIVALLGRQGWQVRDGRLVVGERVMDAAGMLTPLGKDARVASLHPDIRSVADRYLESGHPEVAIFEAFKAINNRVKAVSGIDLDGSALMAKAFADTDPAIVLADLSTRTGANLQAGFRFLFMGALQGIRNPDAHEQFKLLDDTEALDTLAFASLLMRRLDGAHPSTE